MGLIPLKYFCCELANVASLVFLRNIFASKNAVYYFFLKNIKSFPFHIFPIWYIYGYQYTNYNQNHHTVCVSQQRWYSLQNQCNQTMAMTTCFKFCILLGLSFVHTKHFRWLWKLINMHVHAWRLLSLFQITQNILEQRLFLGR